MAVTLKRLEGRDIPCEARRGNSAPVFEITDHQGHHEYRYNDLDAARRVVEVSERGRTDYTGRH
jgi:hypothetical protein